MQTISIIVEGLVQGVYYRQSTKAKASAAGITGEIKNKNDGSVHILATGTEDQLNELVEWCKRGPEMAIVTHVKVEKVPVKNFSGFNIVRG